ncbi:MAG TPA: hypothetical protein VJ144_06860, partial [Candidatus Polarisedimenticolia bacterium]|nr:hypothetical protein [Candidatus Polarisedimenticolia bacterium]
MRLARVLLGALLAGSVLVTLWATGFADPPEAVSRRLALFSAVYPGALRKAVVERIPCAPLRRLRLYVVCTGGCEDVWRIVAVRGLMAENLQSLNRVPPEPPEEIRARIDAAVGRERLRLDVGGARELIGCYMRLDGRHPELVLLEPDREAVEAARGNEEALAAVAEALDEPAALSRVEVREIADGFASRFLYWDTAAPGRPVLELTWRLARDGRVL